MDDLLHVMLEFSPDINCNICLCYNYTLYLGLHVFWMSSAIELFDFALTIDNSHFHDCSLTCF